MPRVWVTPGPVYLDTRARADVLAHPLFPVCFEWPAFLSTRHLPIDDTLSREERLRGVHASHDLVLHRPLRAGVELETRATVSRRRAAYGGRLSGRAAGHPRRRRSEGVYDLVRVAVPGRRCRGWRSRARRRA
jgi:hypothetical protein